MEMNVKEAIDRIVQLGQPQFTSLSAPASGTVPIVMAPNGTSVQSVKRLLDEYATKPDRRQGTDTVQDLESLIEWTNRHKDAGTIVFCDTTRDAPKLLTIVDYHHAVSAAADGALPKSGDDTARFAKFRALYEFPLSEHWKAWREVDDQPMDQVDFAEFLENRVLDLIAPDISTDGEGNEIKKLPPQVAELLARLGGSCALPQDIITLSRGLEITAQNHTATRVDIQSGEGGLMFEETHVGTNKQKVLVPKLFMICIPLFDKSPFHYRIPVRIRYRLAGGIKWTFTMFGADDVIDAAIKEAAEHVKVGTACPLFYGVPG